MKCAECRWWQFEYEDKGQGARYGLCRRMPPSTLIKSGYFEGHGLWPITIGEGWCAEFSPALEWDSPTIAEESE